MFFPSLVLLVLSVCSAMQPVPPKPGCHLKHSLSLPLGWALLSTWAPAFPERHVSGVWLLSLDLMHLRWVCIARVSRCLLLAVSVWWVLERAETLYLSSWTCDEHCRVAAAPHLSSLWNNWDAFGFVVSLWLLPFTRFCNLWCFFHERNGVWLQKMVELIHNLWITC